mgnify:CR=1 FL=1
MAGVATVVSLSGVALVPAGLMAQPGGGVAPQCTIDQNNPKELALMSLKFQSARSAPTPEARKKALRDIVKELEAKMTAARVPNLEFPLPGVDPMPANAGKGKKKAAAK